MANEMWQTRLPKDVNGRAHDFKDEREIGKGEAMRRLVKTGIEAEDHDTVAEPASPRAYLAEQAGLAFAISALVIAPLSLQFTGLGPVAIAYLGLAFATVGLALHARGTISLPDRLRGVD